MTLLEEVLFKGRLGYEYRASPMWESKFVTVVERDYTSGKTVYEIYDTYDGSKLAGKLDARTARKLFKKYTTEGETKNDNP